MDLKADILKKLLAVKAFGQMFNCQDVRSADTGRLKRKVHFADAFNGLFNRSDTVQHFFPAFSPLDGFLPVERTKFLDDCLLMLYFTLLVHVFFQAGITDLLLFCCIGFVVSHIHTNMSLIDLNDFCYDTVQKIPIMGNNQYGS